MDIKFFYGQILGIESPWKVEEVLLDTQVQEVNVRVVHDNDAKIFCPECGESASRYDKAPKRSWRHLDSCQMKTFLHCEVPRVNCQNCKDKTLIPPWTKKHSRFTLMFEGFALNLLLATKCDKTAASILRITPKQITKIKNDAVERGLERRGELEAPESLAIDEKSFGKGHNYLTILVSRDEKKVIDLCPERTQAAVEGLLHDCFSEEELAKVKSITMDMWQAYWNAASENLPNAMRIHDRFHVMQHMLKAIDQCRRSEYKKLCKDDKKLLKNIRYTLLKNLKNWQAKDYERHSLLSDSELDTATVFCMKEVLRKIFEDKYNVEEGKEKILNWVELAQEQKISALTRVSKTIESHIEGIANFFHSRLTNSLSESMNSLIQELKSRARGFRNWQRYRVNILFHFGKLDIHL